MLCRITELICQERKSRCYQIWRNEWKKVVSKSLVIENSKSNAWKEGKKKKKESCLISSHLQSSFRFWFSTFWVFSLQLYSIHPLWLLCVIKAKGIIDFCVCFHRFRLSRNSPLKKCLCWASKTENFSIVQLTISPSLEKETCNVSRRRKKNWHLFIYLFYFSSQSNILLFWLTDVLRIYL